MIKNEEIIEHVDDLLKQKKYQESHKLLTKLISDHPTFGKAYNHLGWLYDQKFEDVKTAEKYYLEAIKHNPEYRATYFNYAVLLSNQYRFEELNELMKKAEKIPGINKSKIYLEYALMNEMQGNFKEAIEYFKKSLTASLTTKIIENAKAGILRNKEKINILSSS